MEAAVLLVLGLATWQAVEVWHHGKLFAGRRAAAETWAGWWYHGPFAVKRMARCRLARPRLLCLKLSHDAWAWLGGLLGCPFCTSVWAGGVLYALWTWTPDWVRVVHYALAASRLANALNDLTHAHCRTPRQAKTGFEAPHVDGPSPASPGSPGPAPGPGGAAL